jgi:hypothetical protein
MLASAAEKPPDLAIYRASLLIGLPKDWRFQSMRRGHRYGMLQCGVVFRE